MSRTYSIIVVTYNNAAGLRETLQSIQSLDYANKEVIVIDGGSQDGTQRIIADNDTLIAFASSEKDNGIYNAMNKGIKHVTGDYVVFMNAGDLFAHKDVLTWVSAYDGDIILGGETYGGKVRMVKEKMTLYDILSIGLNHQAVYYRREILQKYGFDESYKLIADLKSVVEPLVKEQVSVSCVTKILATCDGGGVSQQRWRDTITENKRLIEEVMDPFHKDDYRRMARINNEMINDFITLSYFHSLFPIIRLLSKTAQFINKHFKHIPIE